MEQHADTTQYIAGFPEEIRSKLNQLRACIAETAPEATEKIIYGMPTFYLNGNLVHFAAYSGHIGFYPAPSAIVAFAPELKPYKTSKGAIQFPLDAPLPLKLIADMVRFRVSEQTNPEKQKRT